MSLKGFHIIFLVLAVLSAFGFFAWTQVEHEAAQELGFEMKRYEAARKRLDTRLAPAVALRKQS